MRRTAVAVPAIVFAAVVAGGLLSILIRPGASAAQAQEAQKLLADLALADRQNVEQRGEKLAELALRVAELQPPQNTADIGTFRYLAYSAHVHARQVAQARSPKTAQEHFAKLTGDCVDCHHLFRDWAAPETE